MRGIAIWAVVVLVGCGDDPADQGTVTAVADSYSVEQDQPLQIAAPGVLANDSSSRGLMLYAEPGDPPAFGTLDRLADGSFTYMPQLGFVGTDSFTYAATDLLETSAAVRVEIDVTAAIGAPVATGDAYAVDEDGILMANVLVNDSDPTGMPLTATVIAQPQHGTIALAASGELTYTPAANYHGPDSFVYSASDGTYGAQAMATITVAAVPDAPVAAADSYMTTEDTVLVINAVGGVLANDTDVDGDTLTIVIDTQPAAGTLTANVDGSFTFTPAGNFAGTTSFTYHATDGALTSATVTASIMVTAVNDAPVANAASPSVIEDELLNGFVTGSDIDGNPLTFLVMTPPTHGTLQLATSTGGFRYTPDAGYSGPDSFTFYVNDGMLDSLPATASITVTPAPVPLIKDYSPRVGASGRPLQVWGRYFGTAPTVTVGGASATLTTTNKTYLVATLPASLTAGDHALVVHRSGNDSLAATVRIVPWIESSSPRFGASSGTIALAGTTFGANGSVTIDGVAAATTLWSDTAIDVTVPPGLAPGAHRIRVVTNGVAGNTVTYSVGPNVWAPPAIPAGRKTHAAVWTGNEMVIWGGDGGTGSGALGNGGRYDPLTDRYAPVSTVGAPSPRMDHVAVWTGSEMLVWGGAAGGGRYDPLTDTWTSLAGGPTTNAGCAVWTGTHMIVWGGRTGSVASTSTNAGSRFDPVAGTWTATTTANAPAARYNQICVWTGQRMIVMGGISTSFTGLSTSAAYDPATNTWSSISNGLNSTNSEYREYGTWTGSEVMVKSGRYDPALDQWIATAAPPRQRTGATRIWTGKRVVVWGGCVDGASGCSVESRGEWYEPATDTWGTINSGLSSTSMDHIAVWTGTHMVAHGGGLTFTAGNGGIRYHAGTDTFVGTVDVGGAPLSNGTTVWTGTAAITFGGLSSGSFPSPSSSALSSTPASGVWSAIASSGAPSARFSHIATWTGTTMVVWGGGTSTSNATLNSGTGARYAPGTNTWAPTSLTGAPSARREHRAVWSGTEVIVWGGYNGTSGLADGGRYNPTSDTWTPISTTNAPSPRYRHVAVWTGSELIVWGGYNGTTWLDDGGRYDPNSDTWTPIASSATITARAYAGAVWTGTQMIVWGGQTSTSTSTNTGAAYTPGGSWTALPTTNAPSARLSPAVAWMNDKLFVWGGPPNSSTSNGQANGAIYDPTGSSWAPISTSNAPTSGYSDTALWTGSFVYVTSPPSASPRAFLP